MSGIVQGWEITNKSIRTVAIFLIRMSRSATLCQDASLSAKIGFYNTFFNDKTSFGLFGGEMVNYKACEQTCKKTKCLHNKFCAKIILHEKVRKLGQKWNLD